MYSDLFVERQAAIYRLALMLSGKPEVAEEITAEVFARVLPKWRRGEVSDPVLYLRRAVINEVRSRHRRRVNERHAIGTIKAQTSRALAALRALMEEQL